MSNQKADYSLETLSENVKTILLAEIAALLHNIGKLDPNFLAISTEGNALQSLQKNCVDITEYSFKRFAAPDESLLEESQSVITNKKWASRQELATALRVGVDIAEPAWQLNRFYFGNGPLYHIRKTEREANYQEQKAIEQELKSLKQKLARVAQQLNTAALEDKKPLGIQRGKLKSEIESKEQELSKAQHTLLAQEKEQQSQLEEKFRRFVAGASIEPWPMADLLTLFWDDFFDKEDTEEEKDSDYTRKFALEPWLKPKQGTALPALLVLSHGEVSGAEKSDLEKVSPLWDHLRSATAFGYDRDKDGEWKWELQKARHELIQDALGACKNPVDKRSDFVEEAENKLSMGLGDTQWPINEITLWDFSSSIAALFKSGVARGVLEGEIPTVGDMHWRFLSVRFDGLSFFSQVHHITDLVGRRASVDEALNAAQKLLEETYPLGNEVYRDENGAVFVVPDLEKPDILSLTNGDGRTLEVLLNQAFAGAVEDDGAALAGELVPQVSIGETQKGKQLKLGKYLHDKPPLLGADPAKVAEWWRGQQAEICTVCGVRPMGYKPAGAKMPPWGNPDKAKKRHICCVCLHRRGRRAEHWLTKEPSTTIWTDEVVDENGRFALLVGQFNLGNWLDGTLIGTMKKPNSFARVRRVWETTQEFWKDVKNDVISKKILEQPRLAIRPQNGDSLDLGRYHAYELRIGEGINVVWDPVGKELILTERLSALRKRLDLSDKEKVSAVLLRWIREHQETSGWSLFEPSGYGSLPQDTGQKISMEFVHDDVRSYTPNIPLVAEPALFMTLIPADKAMPVVQAIKEKYEREMSKVQDRFPLHLGVVIAKRRTPLRAVLDAGRAMLERQAGWQKWQIVENEEKPAADAPKHLKDDPHFAKWRHIRLEQDARKISLRMGEMMGDGGTPDRWHTHFLPYQSDHDGECIDDVIAALITNKAWKNPGELEKGKEIYVTPSTFDFEYLDTTARRFEIAYDETGQRRGRPTRPYYLGEIDELQKVWEIISAQMSSTQWMHITELIERKRRAWKEPYGLTDKYSEAFEQFVSDTLHNIERKPKPKKAEDWALLERAALHGMLDDVIDLYHEALKEPEEA